MCIAFHFRIGTVAPSLSLVLSRIQSPPRGTAVDSEWQWNASRPRNALKMENTQMVLNFRHIALSLFGVNGILYVVRISD